MSGGSRADPAPTRVRKFAPIATHAVNPMTVHVAGWMPGFALLIHHGRRTGRTYRTPVNVFPRGDQFVFVLTYGRSQWVKNVLAAGGCEMRYRRRDVRLVNPEIISDPAMTPVPGPVRFIARVIGVTEMMRMSAR